MTEKSGCALAVTAGPQNHSGWLNKPEMCLSEDWHISRLTNSSRLSPPVRNANRISGESYQLWNGMDGIALEGDDFEPLCFDIPRISDTDAFPGQCL